MEEFVKGQIVVVPFPFSDLSDFKKRPAVVISSLKGNNLILAQVTSKERTARYSLEIKTSDFETGGLYIDSFVNCDKIFTLDKSIILDSVGNLSFDKTTEIISKVVDIVKS
jgi:mRNA interferase MazF